MHLYTESIRVDEDTFDKTAILRVDDKHTVNVKHTSREVLLTDTVETCWFASNNGHGVVEGGITDYLQKSPFAE